MITPRVNHSCSAVVKGAGVKEVVVAGGESHPGVEILDSVEVFSISTRKWRAASA